MGGLSSLWCLPGLSWVAQVTALGAGPSLSPSWKETLAAGYFSETSGELGLSGQPSAPRVEPFGLPSAKGNVGCGGCDRI